MSYRYDSFTDRFIHIDDEQPNVAVGTPQMPIMVKEIDLTERCIERIAEIVAKKLRETCNDSADDAVNASNAHWIKGANDSGYIRCSKCGYNDVVERLDYFIYCPNCGARMVEDD